MRYSGLTIVFIAVSALCLAGCASTKQTASKEVLSFKVQDTREQEARDSVRLELRDTLKEVTTVTVQLNETGDTVKVSTVTDRTRASDRSQLRDKSEKIIVRVDTVYVERRDSVMVETPRQARGDIGRASALSYLKWIFWIIVSVTVLLMVIKMFNLFKV